MEYVVQCAWCNRYQNEKGEYDSSYKPNFEKVKEVSHGICIEDMLKMKEDLREEQ